jgi:predicted DNA-binding transcriptional regulator AlpA
VATWLGIKKCTLEKARSMRMGNFPPFIRIGRVIRYQRTSVQAWLQGNAYNVDGTKAA